METEKAPPREFGIKPMEFNEVDLGKYHVKYAFRPERDDLIFQFFMRDGVGGTFPANFRGNLFNSFVRTLGLAGEEQNRIVLDWVPEAESWFVGVSTFKMVPPGTDIIKGILEESTGAPLPAEA